MFTLQQKHRHMIYQDYFRNSDFEDIWTILNGFYLEHEDLKTMYASLVEVIKTLPIEEKYSDSTIQMCLDLDNEILVKGAPDPQEWLVGREVKIDFSSWKDNFDEEAINDSPGLKTFDMLSGKEKRELARQSDTATLAAHLLYWSTLYAIKTQEQHENEFSEWLDNLENNVPVKYEIESEYLSESSRRKQCKYWRDTVGGDTAISWSSNLSILKKKLEFNIGYWRYVQRHAGWQEDVNRMNIAINLMEIATTDFLDITGKHINLRTANRYTHEHDHGGDLHELYLKELYSDKAFHILWRWLDHNMENGGIDKIFNPVSHFDTSSF